MRLVIADSSPINYLILIAHIDILPALFKRVILPSVVRDELAAGSPLVRLWTIDAPAWVEIRKTNNLRSDDALKGLDAGEQDAIALAIELNAELLLMDDREGVVAARAQGLTVIGTLGVLGLAAQRGFLDLAEKLRLTNFRYRQEIMDALLEAVGRKA